MCRWGPEEYDVHFADVDEETPGPPPYNLTLRKGSKVKHTVAVYFCIQSVLLEKKIWHLTAQSLFPHSALA